jgi:hypothetical protein
VRWYFLLPLLAIASPAFADEQFAKLVQAALAHRPSEGEIQAARATFLAHVSPPALDQARGHAAQLQALGFARLELGQGGYAIVVPGDGPRRIDVHARRSADLEVLHIFHLRPHVQGPEALEHIKSYVEVRSGAALGSLVAHGRHLRFSLWGKNEPATKYVYRQLRDQEPPTLVAAATSVVDASGHRSVTMTRRGTTVRRIDVYPMKIEARLPSIRIPR